MAKFPKQLRFGSAMSFTIEHGFMGRTPETALRTLGPFVLPEFQRPQVWTRSQQSLFIESVWLGLPIASYAYNQSPTLGETDNWLIDGQQRWTALHEFVADRVPVFGDLRYSDMSLPQTRQFKNTVFPCILIKSDDVEFLHEVYQRLAYGGTPHEAIALAEAGKDGDHA